MKTLLAVVLVVLAAGSSFAQTRTAGKTAGKKEGFSKKAPAPRSMNADSVAAALNTHTSTANQLTQIEHQGVRPAAHAASHPAVAAAPRVAPAQNRNKPMKFSYKAPHSGVTAGK
jgi:hypothetical protein